MIDAAGYARSENYRKQFPFVPEDRPLIVQLGGSDPADLAAAAALAAPFCDGVELNIGCPQRCARKAGAREPSHPFYLILLPVHPVCAHGIACAGAGAEPR